MNVLKLITGRLRNKLLTIFVLLLPTIFTAIYSINSFTNSVVSSVQANQLQTSKSQATTVENFLVRFNFDLLVLSQSVSMRTYVDSLLDQPNPALRGKEIDSLVAFLRTTTSYKDVTLLDSNGHEIIRVDASGPAPIVIDDANLEDLSSQNFFLQSVILAPGQVYIDDLDLNRTKGVIDTPYLPIIRYATPLYADDGNLAGALVLKARLAPILLEIEQGSQGTIYLVDKQGSYWLNPDSGQLYSRILKTDATLSKNQPDTAKRILTEESGVIEQPTALQSFAQITPPDQPSVRWTIITEVPLSAILGNIHNTQIVLLAAIFVSLGLTIVVALFFISSIVNPVRQLVRSAEAIGRGDWNTALPPIRGNDEIAQLTDSFGKMAKGLNEIYELQKHTHELEVANATALEANRTKSEFLATMSHELRTPLNAMIGFTELLISGNPGPLVDKQKHQLNRIHANSLRLLRLIDDILDLARIEAGRTEIQNELFSPEDMVSKLSTQVSSLAERKQLKFYSTIDNTLPKQLLGDRQRIEQIVLNLLSNAFKFTERGEVELSLKPSADSTQWLISVRDTGPGIPPHAQEYIFEEFRQVDGSSRRAYGGTGLGLAICRNLSRLMQGNIRVQSTLGQGSTFIVTLPLIINEQQPEKTATVNEV